MANMFRIRVPWSGTAVVGGGVTTLYFDGAATAASITPALNTFFTAIKGYIASGVTWSIPNGGDVIESTDNSLAGTWSSGGAYTIATTGAGAYAAGVGGRINWGTGAIISGRRLRGSTFLVPMVGSQYESDGSILNATVTGVNTAATSLISTLSGNFVAYHRPQTLDPMGGEFHPIMTGIMPDKVSWLRTRRT